MVPRSGSTVRRRKRSPMTVSELGELIIWVGAVLGALLVMGAFLRMAVVNPLKRNTNAELETVKKDISKVLREVAPETGPSMGERVRVVEIGVASLDQRMSDHLLTHSSMISISEQATNARQ